MISLMLFEDTDKFKGDGVPSLVEIEDCLKESFPNVVETQVDEERDKVEIQIGPQRATIAPKRPPLSWGVLERPCKHAASFYWPNAVEKVQRHRWHMIIVLHENDSDPVTRAMLLSRLTAELGTCFGYSAVYWESATKIHAAEDFNKFATDLDVKNFPIGLWVKFETVANSDGSHTHWTTGMDAFDLMDIEIPRFNSDPATVESFSFNLAQYMLEGKKTVLDGDTIGSTEDHKITCHHVNSMFDETRKVIYFEI